MRDDQIRDKWREAGGSFHGPRVEHASMEERAFLRFLGGLYDEIAELRAALEPIRQYVAELDRAGIPDGASIAYAPQSRSKLTAGDLRRVVREEA